MIQLARLRRTLSVTLAAALALAACQDRKDDKSPAPPPEGSAPAPAATDKGPATSGDEYQQPGGKGGFEVGGDDGGTTEVQATKFPDSDGPLQGSSFNDRSPNRPITECMKEYYFAVSERQRSVANCADRGNWRAICDAARVVAFARATRAKRLCDLLPSCRGKVNWKGELWSCDHVQSHLGASPDGGQEIIDIYWDRSCLAQYEVVCIES